LSNGITNVSISVLDVSLPVNENCMKTAALQFFRYVTTPSLPWRKMNSNTATITIPLYLYQLKAN